MKWFVARCEVCDGGAGGDGNSSLGSGGGGCLRWIGEALTATVIPEEVVPLGAKALQAYEDLCRGNEEV